jgi:hypothetical protein
MQQCSAQNKPTSACLQALQLFHNGVLLLPILMIPMQDAVAFLNTVTVVKVLPSHAPHP